MDGRQFDHLVKGLAGGTSRRTVLKGLVGGLVGFAFTRKPAAAVGVGESCAVAACDNGLFCCSGICRECCGSPDCGPCAVCNSNLGFVCLSTCSGTLGLCCNNGGTFQCQNCCVDSDCPVPTSACGVASCSSGQCIEIDDSSLCGACETCQSGACVSDCTAEQVCCDAGKGGFTCQECCAGEDSTCGDCQICDVELLTCIDTCDTGEVCCDSTCTECCEDSDCPPSTAECGRAVCTDGQCGESDDGSLCDACQTCDVQSLTCHDDCETGEICCGNTCTTGTCDPTCESDTDCEHDDCCCEDGSCSIDCCKQPEPVCKTDSDCGAKTCCCASGACSGDCCVEAPVIELPNTGAGDDDAGQDWLTGAALLGGAAAILGAKLKSDSDQTKASS